MSSKGTVSLCNSVQVLDRVVYSSRPDRKRIIDGWKMRYGPKINGCYIQIEPETNDATNEDGSNYGNRYVGYKHRVDPLR